MMKSGITSRILDKSVAEAVLSVYEISGGTSGEEVEARCVKAAWTPSALTWNSRPGIYATLMDSFTYDAAGNPLAYRGGSALAWSAGRRLSSHETAACRSEYTYNDAGIRTGKSVTDKASGAVTATEYYLSDGDIIAEERSSGNVTETIWYAYSGSGSLAGFIYDGEDYYYRKNLEGDITGIYDDGGNLKVTYTYDMWGKLTGVTDTSGTGLADVNPFRYRGYYYDSETGYYYLNSR